MTKEDILILLAASSDEELSYILGRYCGPGNRILAEKKFGRTVDKLVDQEVLERSLLGVKEIHE